MVSILHMRLFFFLVQERTQEHRVDHVKAYVEFISIVLVRRRTGNNTCVPVCQKLTFELGRLLSLKRVHGTYSETCYTCACKGMYNNLSFRLSLKYLTHLQITLEITSPISYL